MKSGPRESPHFVIQPTNPCSVSPIGCQSSPFFAQSPCSVVGSVRSLGSLMCCFLSSEEAAEWGQSCCFNRGTPTKRARHLTEEIHKPNRPCDSCRKSFEAVLNHFDSCPRFQKLWKESDQARPLSLSTDDIETAVSDEKIMSPISTDSICMEQLEFQWHKSVRHLCSHGCFYKAYAPVREWHKMRQAVRLQYSDAMDVKLRGWQCRIMPATQPARVEFIQPNGEAFGGTLAVLKSLAKHASSSTDGYCTETRTSTLIDQSASKRRRILSLFADKSERPYSSPHASRLEHFTSVLSESASPLGVLEELFCEQPWHLLVSTIFLNRTTRAQVDPVLAAFFERWPSPEAMIMEMQRKEQKTLENGHAKTSLEKELANMLHPLGLYEKRAAGIIQFTHEYMELISERQNELDTAKGLAAHLNETVTSQASLASNTIDDKKYPLSCSTVSASLLTRQDVLSLHQCGTYAAAAYRVFVQHDLDALDSDDHALVAYAAYKQATRTSATNERTTSPSDRMSMTPSK